jgi:two-component system, OmpR family, response regulator VicR
MKFLMIGNDQNTNLAIKLTFQIHCPDANLIIASKGERGIKLAETDKPDFIILDMEVPDINGYDVLKAIRVLVNVPILILTVISNENDIVRCLESGADDFINKPFKQLEVLARVKALLHEHNNHVEDEMLSCGTLRFNTKNYQLFHNGLEINLTRSEYLIVRHLMINAGHVVTHFSLAKALWGAEYPDAPKALKVHIRRLREKLEVNPSQPRLILTKPRLGYALVAH